MSPEEVAEYMALIEERGPRASAADREANSGDFDIRTNLLEFLENDDGQEFVMLNLNVYREAP